MESIIKSGNTRNLILFRCCVRFCHSLQSVSDLSDQSWQETIEICVFDIF